MMMNMRTGDSIFPKKKEKNGHESWYIHLFQLQIPTSLCGWGVVSFCCKRQQKKKIKENERPTDNKQKILWP